ncbi:MAG TPA: trypsin-like serine protease [Candidatus Limnocylindrales bacterium]|jgi:secreted trypsin-like serine protease|nr:trypsin-like serine protease [Candidatus Limnocylindrales bacterium]
MRRTLIALASAVVLGAAMVAPAAAITGDYREDNDHPFVGLVSFYDSDWVFIHRCTGELLSPTVLLTAGHCTNDDSLPDGAVAAHARVWFLQDVGSHYDPNTQSDPVTGYPDSCTGTLGDGIAGGWCAESSTMYNFGFDNFAGLPNIHDLGIVILDQAIDLPEYASLASANSVDTLQTARGTQDPTMRVSGYGLSLRHLTPVKGPNAGTGPSAYTISYRVRLQGDMTFMNLESNNSGGFTLEANGNGNGQSGTCNGDSGGPVFWPADSNRVVAVSSWGILNAGCRGTGYYYRTDLQASLDWIRSVVGEELWAGITVN